MTPQKAKSILKEYKENEDGNHHSENFLILAEAFKDGRAIWFAKQNLANWDHNPLVSSRYYRAMAYETCNPYYYKLIELCHGVIDKPS